MEVAQIAISNVRHRLAFTKKLVEFLERRQLFEEDRRASPPTPDQGPCKHRYRSVGSFPALERLFV